jgi:hypothetical protein
MSKHDQIIALREKANDTSLSDNERDVSRKMAKKLTKKYGEPKGSPSSSNSKYNFDKPDDDMVLSNKMYTVKVSKAVMKHPEFANLKRDALSWNGCNFRKIDSAYYFTTQNKNLATFIGILVRIYHIEQVEKLQKIKQKRAEEEKRKNSFWYKTKKLFGLES